jgi:D-cysteine desulfhydrase
VTAPGTPPRTRLAVLPTPLLAAPRLADALGLAGGLLVKRDDLTGFAVAGNKARQLEFLLAEAQERRADVLVTGGSIGSNFVQAAAAGAAYAGLECVLALAGLPVGPDAHPNLAAAIGWGARPRWTGQPDRGSVDELLPVLAAELRGQGRTPYVVPRGGACATGAAGYRVAVDELLRQLPGHLGGHGDQAVAAVPDPRPILLLATGSGGTQAGLVAGNLARGRPVRVVGASVSRSVEEVAPRVLAMAREVARRYGEQEPEEADVQLVDARGPGHALASAEGDAAAALALRCAGLVLDPVYTAKALAALPSVVGTEPAIFWHTGGLLDAVAGMIGYPR